MAPENAPPHVPPADCCCAAKLITGKATPPLLFRLSPSPTCGSSMICRAVARNATGLTTLRHATCWARKLFLPTDR